MVNCLPNRPTRVCVNTARAPSSSRFDTRLARAIDRNQWRTIPLPQRAIGPAIDLHTDQTSDEQIQWTERDEKDPACRKFKCPFGKSITDRVTPPQPLVKAREVIRSQAADGSPHRGVAA